MHLCAELTVAFWMLKPFGEIGANFSLQLSTRIRFDKINKKKVIAENQCEKHKKSSLMSQCYSHSNLVTIFQQQKIHSVSIDMDESTNDRSLQMIVEIFIKTIQGLSLNISALFKADLYKTFQNSFPSTFNACVYHKLHTVEPV